MESICKWQKNGRGYVKGDGFSLLHRLDGLLLVQTNSVVVPLVNLDPREAESLANFVHPCFVPVHVLFKFSAEDQLLLEADSRSLMLGLVSYSELRTRSRRDFKYVALSTFHVCSFALMLAPSLDSWISLGRCGRLQWLERLARVH